jgi:hypothetical protein
MVASSALGTSAAVTGGAASGKGTGLGIAKAVSLAKWVGIVGAAGIGATTSAVVLHEMHDARPAHIAMSQAAARALPPTKEAHAKDKETVRADEGWTPAPVDPLTIPLLPVDEPALPVLARTTPAVVEDVDGAAASTVPGELTMLELARGALAAGDVARCLSMLDRYAAQFPRGSMAPEETMLRIEALMKTGDASAARQIADAYLASDPEGPYGARVRSLLQVPNP